MKNVAHAWALSTTILAAACQQTVSPVPVERCALTIPAHRGSPTDTLLLAGSGATIAPMRIVARNYRQRFDTQVTVSSSIGTKGAIHALRDGAISIGLASRALETHEKSGLHEHPLLRVGVAIIINKTSEPTDIKEEDVQAWYRGVISTWPDGTPITLLSRQPGDSTLQAIERAYPTLGQDMQRATREGRTILNYTDQQMRDNLLQIRGAVGVLDVGTIALNTLPLQVISLNGVRPTRENIENGSYPLSITLSLLTRDSPSEQVQQFVDFARAQIVSGPLANPSAGYLPLRPALEVTP